MLLQYCHIYLCFQKGAKMSNEKKPKEEKKNFLDKEFLGIQYQYWIMAGVILVLGLAYVLSQNNPEKNININEIKEGEGKINYLNIAIITDKELCPDCEKYSSFLELLKKNNIAYKLLIWDKNSQVWEETKKRYNILHYPTYLIDENSIKVNMLIKTNSGKRANLKEVLDFYISKYREEMNYSGMPKYKIRYHKTDKIYVVEDVFDWDFKQHISYIADSNSDLNKAKEIKLFYDPFDPFFLENYYKFKPKLKDLNIDFYFYPQETARFEKEYFEGKGEYSGWLNVPKYFICMSEQNLFWDFADIYVKYYCDVNSINEAPDKCAESKHAGYPLSDDELVQLRDKMKEKGLDLVLFAICYGKGNIKIEEQKEEAKKLHVYEAPTLIVQDRYQGYLTNPEILFCGLKEFQNLEMCSK